MVPVFIQVNTVSKKDYIIHVNSYTRKRQANL